MTSILQRAGLPGRGVALPPLKSTQLLDQLRERIRALHYSLRTEEAYVYGCRAFIRCMRLTEGLRLRVKDIDFAHRAIVVRDGKGGKDPVLMLPRTLEHPLREQLARALALWVADRQAGRGGVEMPKTRAPYPAESRQQLMEWVAAGLHGVCLGAAGPALRAVLATPKGEVILEGA